jgi:zinc/manganese transport system permease protein
VLALDDATLILLAVFATITLAVLAIAWRPLVLECVDPNFLRSVSGVGAPVHIGFLVLVVLNLVAGFHALGTLLAVGIMMLPAVAARFWATDLTRMVAIAVFVAFLSGVGGLLLSYHLAAPSGPAIILVAGLIYVVSIALGPVGGLRRRFAPGRHLEA